MNDIKIEYLSGNGSYDSEECIALLQEADVVVTNPPFSLFREYVEQLIKYDKLFLIIGNNNAITYKEFFPLIKENKVWLGVTLFTGKMPYFKVNDDYPLVNNRFIRKEDGLYKQVNGVCWFTNLDHKKRHEELLLYKKYNTEEYPKYDNYDAIEVSKVVDIPMDYDGVMGVPITFLDKYCPTQFEIIGLDRYVEDNPHYGHRFNINGKEIYARILIKKL